MENSLKLQMDVKNNAEDLRRYMLDLQSWEDEMRQKESGLKSQDEKVADIPPPRNKIKRNLTNGQGNEKKLTDSEKKQKKIHAYDYSAWDKYDVDKACAEIDKEPEEELEASQPITQEVEEKKEEKVNEIEKVDDNKSNLKDLDEAFYEKELGNQFVRKEKWEDAVQCYTRAIKLDSRNAIYYANRALCFNKLKNFRAAEVDSTVAIQLDNTYVKAYQRRAFARFALGQIQEALSDYKEIVKLEPKNVHANNEIIKIEKKLKDGISGAKESKSEKKIFNPKTIFKSETKKAASVNDESTSVNTNLGGMKETKLVEKMKEPAKEVEVKITKGNLISKPIEKKEKVEKSSEVKEEDDVFHKIPDGFTIVKPMFIPPHLRSKKPLQRIPVKDIITDSEIFDEFVRMSNSMSTRNEETEKKPERAITRDETPDLSEIESLPKPKTFLQFQNVWKMVKRNPKHAFSYLKKTTPENLYKILRHNLESDLLSELISILPIFAKTDGGIVHSILVKLTGVDRFRSLILFLSPEDKKNLSDCIDSLKLARSDQEKQELREVYRLENV